MRIVICNGTALVWNAKDVRTLREEHRIVGNLIGSHPRAPYQNLQLALPLKLLPEEVTLLKDRGVAVLVDGTFGDETPSEEMLTQFAEYRRKQYEDQNAVFQAESLENFRRFREKIDDGREKRRQRSKNRGADSDQAPSDERQDVIVRRMDDQAPSDERQDVIVRRMDEQHEMVQLFHEDPWRRLDEPEVTWSYPCTEGERLRYAVFQDLWTRGYYLTSGTKFGGDFLVYPGDPLMYHSFHVAICTPDNTRLSAEDLVSMGRLGSNVRKTVLLCSVEFDTIDPGDDSRNRTLVADVNTRLDNTENEMDGKVLTSQSAKSSFRVHYLTLEWTGVR